MGVYHFSLGVGDTRFSKPGFSQGVFGTLENMGFFSPHVVKFNKESDEEGLATKRDLKELELRLTVRLGTIMAAGIAVVAAFVKLLSC